MHRKIRGARRLTVFGAFTAAILGTTLFFFPTWVEGTSMEGTLHSGELIITSRISVGPMHRGEIVIFRPPTSAATGFFIKRVIGLPGETVSIRGGQVYVNGQELPEPYLPAGTPTPSSALFSVKVPDNAIFVLGDHRSNSWDSRAFGPVPMSSIVGYAWFGIPPQGSPRGL